MADLRLSRASTKAIVAPPQRHCWPLKVTAVSDLPNLGSEIFVYHTGVLSGSTSAVPGAVFEAVASLPQMQEIPVGVPGVDPVSEEPVPFYRADTLLFYCRSAVEADELWLKVQADVRALVANYHAALLLEETETVIIE